MNDIKHYSIENSKNETMLSVSINSEKGYDNVSIYRAFNAKTTQSFLNDLELYKTLLNKIKSENPDFYKKLMEQEEAKNEYLFLLKGKVKEILKNNICIASVILNKGVYLNQVLMLNLAELYKLVEFFDEIIVQKDFLEMKAEENILKKVMTKKELIELSKTFTSKHFLDKTAIKDWTSFVADAMTIGVSEFEIDQYQLSDEEFDEKYGHK